VSKHELEAMIERDVHRLWAEWATPSFERRLIRDRIIRNVRELRRAVQASTETTEGL
jgi:hypothetical protein